MKNQLPFGFNFEVKVKTKIMDAKTGRCVKESPWRKNLILDAGLDGLAYRTSQSLNTSGFANLTTRAAIGSGTNPNSIASGAVTFTQAATTVTASAGFFTAGMVGGILKYGAGSAGVEYYITAFISTTQVTVDTSATVGATVGTVWMVQQTTLQTPISDNTAYLTSAGSNSTTFNATSLVHKRTFLFGAGPYTVNEIGYAPVAPSGNANRVAGRLVLPSSDVVGASNFYVVILSLTVSFAPATPLAVGNVGTNINTAGNAMIEYSGFTYVNADGTTNGGDSTALDIGSSGGGSGCILNFSTATYTQNATVPTNNVEWGGSTYAVLDVTTTPSEWVYASALGTAQRSFGGSVTTAGQTLYGMGMRRNFAASKPVFDIKFTTPQTAPTGSFNPVTVFKMVCGRTLTN
jgi:hypothetical protein